MEFIPFLTNPTSWVAFRMTSLQSIISAPPLKSRVATRYTFAVGDEIIRIELIGEYVVTVEEDTPELGLHPSNQFDDVDFETNAATFGP